MKFPFLTRMFCPWSFHSRVLPFSRLKTRNSLLAAWAALTIALAGWRVCSLTVVLQNLPTRSHHCLYLSGWMFSSYMDGCLQGWVVFKVVLLGANQWTSLDEVSLQRRVRKNKNHNPGKWLHILTPLHITYCFAGSWPYVAIRGIWTELPRTLHVLPTFKLVEHP